MIRDFWLGLVMCLAIGAAAKAADEPARIPGGRFGQVRFYAPSKGKPLEGMVVLVSDKPGWDAPTEQLARHLLDGGQAVLGIDLSALLASLAQDKGDCSSVNGDFEMLSRRVEKDLPFRQFHPPVLLGLGMGSLVAYTAISGALPNTFEGAIGIGFTPAPDLGRKLCLPIVSAVAGQPIRYGPAPGHETPFVFTPAADFAAPDGGMQAFLAAMPDAHAIAVQATPIATADEALRQVPEFNAFKTPVSGLPVVELPAKGGGDGTHPLVIFYSGDGGWRDIDKQIGGYLSDRGFLVIGFDSLRYFWRERRPREMAADLDVLIRRYAPQYKGKGVILVGYSFGADLLPFMVNRMAADTRKEIRLISLLGVSVRASFEIRLEGILGGANKDGPETLPELVKIKNIPIQCVYGAEETDSVCMTPELNGLVDRVAMRGNHHFGGDYNVIADHIIAAAKSRIGQ